MGTDGTSPEPDHLWNQLRARDPQHSERYSQRWRDMAAAGHDLDGEARFVTAMAAPGASVLDAGCGQGRVGGHLAEKGYDVVGVDLDEQLISEARESFPQGEWLVGDLADFRHGGSFDVVVSAGNVLTFLDPRTRRSALMNLARVLTEDGRLVTGFGAGRGYDFAEYEADLAAAGLEVQHRFSTWNLHPFTRESDFLVCVSAHASRD